MKSWLACLESIKIYYRIERSAISYLRFILEAYDGVGILTTVDAEAGIVVLSVAPDCLPEAGMIIKELMKETLIEELSGGELEKYGEPAVPTELA